MKPMGSSTPSASVAVTPAAVFTGRLSPVSGEAKCRPTKARGIPIKTATEVLISIVQFHEPCYKDRDRPTAKALRPPNCRKRLMNREITRRYIIFAIFVLAFVVRLGYALVTPAFQAPD